MLAQFRTSNSLTKDPTLSEFPPIRLLLSHLYNHKLFTRIVGFDMGERNASPPWVFMPRPQPRSSTWPQHNTTHRMYRHSFISASGSQSHFGLPPTGDAAALTPADGRGDSAGLADLPSASDPAVDMFLQSSGSSSKTFDKVARRRISRGAS